MVKKIELNLDEDYIREQAQKCIDEATSRNIRNMVYEYFHKPDPNYPQLHGTGFKIIEEKVADYLLSKEVMSKIEKYIDTNLDLVIAECTKNALTNQVKKNIYQHIGDKKNG